MYHETHWFLWVLPEALIFIVGAAGVFFAGYTYGRTVGGMKAAKDLHDKLWDLMSYDGTERRKVPRGIPVGHKPDEEEDELAKYDNWSNFD